MKICVYGAGAIGGLIAAKLALDGNEVTIIDRGPHLQAINERGILLREKGGTSVGTKVRAVQNAHEAGPHDLWILAVKTYSLPEIAADVARAAIEDAVILTVQNGIPWWYFHKACGAFNGKRLERLDPTGALQGTIDLDRVIGCVAYPAARIVAPGIIEQLEGDYFPVGELDGAKSIRATAIANAFLSSGLRSRVLEDIRAEIWLKGIGTLAFNPISALTHCTMGEICSKDLTRDLAKGIMQEAEAVATALGVTMRHTIDRRLEGAQAVGHHKTSMLQDIEKGQPIELEALVGVFIELSSLVGKCTPLIQAIYSLVQLLSQKCEEQGALDFFARSGNEGSDVPLCASSE